MLLTLEALNAEEGDCLLLSCGTAAEPQHILVDGGPRATYANSLRPRLIRDFTVPSGILSTSAISRYSISCRSLKMTASRRSAESCRNACPSSSLASRLAKA